VPGGVDARALQLGLVTRVVPAEQLDEAVDALAGKLAQAAPQALRGVLDAVVIGGEAGLATGLDYETQAFALAFSTEDMKEGTGAFLERRKPQFSGR
jgi:enoyl-CoA hydratase